MLALLDATGVPRPGWPIVVKDTSWCDHVLPVADGSVRVVCSLDNETDRFAAFGFDANGALLPGWPVDGMAYEISARVIGTDLTLYSARSLGEDAESQASPAGSTVGANGAVERGKQVGDPGRGVAGRSDRRRRLRRRFRRFRLDPSLRQRRPTGSMAGVREGVPSVRHWDQVGGSS